MSGNHVNRLFREVGGIVCFFAALIVLLALASFDVNDPGWSQTGNGDDVRNSVGRAGAWFADISFYLLGYMAYLIPVVLALGGWLLFRDARDDVPEEKPSYQPFLIVRLIGIALMLMSAAGLADLHVSVAASELPRGTFGGGVLGTAVAWRLVSMLQHLGTTLVLLAVFFCSLTLAFGTSWLRLVELLGAAVINLVDGARRRFRAMASARLEYEKIANADRARAERMSSQRDHTGSWFRRWFSRDDSKPSDPLLEDDEINVAGSAGLAAALAMAREKSGAQPDTGKSGLQLDSMGDSLQKADALLAEQFDQTMQIDRATQAALNSIDRPLDSADGKPPATRLPTIEPTTRKKVAIKQRSKDQKQTKLFLDVPDSDLPPLSLLDAPEPQRPGFSDSDLQALSRLLEQKLAEFRIEVRVVAVHPGPVITRFEMELAPGIKASRITSLSQDIARSMSLVSVRVVEVIAGKSTIGIEVPNDHREVVQLTEMLQSSQYNEKSSSLTLALGKDISGQAVTADLGRMPHLLVAGTTGSGKSVAVNSMLISLLYKATAKDVRLILIDPKMLELNVYDGIPHLLAPVVTDMKEAANALRWCVGEMERRYTLMAALKVRNIAGYNKKVNESIKTNTPIVDPLYQAELSLTPTAAPPTLEPMPFIVVVVDEFADMMMQVGKKAEELIARIAQKARAAGIHLVLATQRPSVDVITGLIKANVPTRIAFQVSSKVDSRTIIDQGGAESLLGHGDMLYLPPGTALPMRVHGAFVDDHEVQNVVAHIKQTGEPNYIEEILQESTAAIPGISGGEGESTDTENDALYDQAVAVVLESRKASISYVQRRLKIGYNRAARMVEAMEAAGVVSQVTSNGTREVLAPPPG
ncbi:MAG: DNA translocase FtsK 4TM domain-containing protein [Granulosicoccus sp.]|nr:DNA translocase FtsK 4TM domain-containing protein [Granulosicoccus sp.]